MRGVRLEVLLHPSLRGLPGYREQFLPRLGERLLRVAQSHFEQEQDPWGKPWKPSQRVLAQGGKTLYLSGALFHSLFWQESSSGLRLGSDLDYGLIHNQGGPFGKSELPQRAFLGWGDQEEAAYQSEVARFKDQAREVQ